MSSHIHIISCMLFQELLGTFFTDYVLSTSERYLRKALDRYKEVLLMFAQSVDQQGQVPSLLQMKNLKVVLRNITDCLRNLLL